MRSHFVTDRLRFGLSVEELVARAARAAAAGATAIQVRERDLADHDLVLLVRDILRVAATTGTKVLVNDRTDIALAAGADGVHLRGDSIPAPRVRTMTGPGFIVGRSVHSLDDVDAACAGGGCDYLLFGTIFPSAGKPPGHHVTGVEVLREACRRSTVPIIAIGGIDRSRLHEIAASGAAGFAAVGMFM